MSLSGHFSKNGEGADREGDDEHRCLDHFEVAYLCHKFKTPFVSYKTKSIIDHVFVSNKPMTTYATPCIFTQKVGKERETSVLSEYRFKWNLRRSSINIEHVTRR